MAGGKRPGAGRKKGSRNKASAARELAITARGLTPLAYILSIVRDETAKTELRNDMAKAAAPYVHPRLAAVEHTGTDEKYATPQRWHVEIVPTPKRENTLPSSESLPSNAIAQLTQEPRHPSAGAITSCGVNGEEIPRGQWVTYVTGRAW